MRGVLKKEADPAVNKCYFTGTSQHFTKTINRRMRNMEQREWWVGGGGRGEERRRGVTPPPPPKRNAPNGVNELPRKYVSNFLSA